jgi:hypothetical protein
MSRNVIFVLMYHSHTLLGLNYFSYGLAIEYVKNSVMVAGGGGGGCHVSSRLRFKKKSKLKRRKYIKY